MKVEKDDPNKGALWPLANFVMKAINIPIVACLLGYLLGFCAARL